MNKHLWKSLVFLATASQQKRAGKLSGSIRPLVISLKRTIIKQIIHRKKSHYILKEGI